MSCIALDIELADKNGIKELGVFIDDKSQAYSFRPPNKYKTTEQAFRCTRDLQGIVWNSGSLEYSELSNILPRSAKVNKEPKNARFLAIYWIKRWKIRKITALPKFMISLMKNFGFAPVTHSDTGTHLTVRSVK